MNFSYISRFGNWILWYSNKPNWIEKLEKTSCQFDTKLSIETQILYLNMKILITTTKLKKKLNLLKIKHLWNKKKSNWKYTAKFTSNPWFFLLWNSYRTSTKAFIKKTAKIIWSFLLKANSARKSTFKTATTKKNRPCKSMVTKTRTGTHSIVTTIEPTWYCSLRRYYPRKNWKDTLIIKNVSSQQFSRFDFSIPTPSFFQVITKRLKRAFFTDAIRFTENHIFSSTNSLTS